MGECRHVGVGAAVTTSCVTVCGACGVCCMRVRSRGALLLVPRGDVLRAYVHARAHTEPGFGVAGGLLLSVVHWEDVC
jgi:hypothetical protein